MANYTKTKTGSYKVEQLQTEINSSPDIVPSCTSITGKGDQLTLEFADTLTSSEESTLDSIIADHTPSTETVETTQLPFSTIDSNKVAVHTTYKPNPPGKTLYSVWTSAGDDLSSGTIQDGPMLDFDLTSGTSHLSKDMYFDPQHGDVWVHEGYLKFDGGGAGDCVDATIIAQPTPLQTSSNLDLIVDNNWIKHSPDGDGTGTHGWKDSNKIVLLPRTFSHDGDWDYDGSTLTPNFDGNGEYKISDIERPVHKFVNKVPCRGSSPFFALSSNESTKLGAYHFVRITAYNSSDTNWSCAVMVEIFRERTTV